ncbi:MAG: hypothetical protein QOF09_3074, partial [Alphaproteobacteria bacterium]|nr:hypothetical protein [Alphaproteobacteria bacterium]
MKEETIFTNWNDQHSELWGNEPICISHRLHRSPLFTRDALAELIESYPREHYNIFHMGEKSSDRWYWRQGDLDGMAGKD